MGRIHRIIPTASQAGKADYSTFTTLNPTSADEPASELTADFPDAGQGDAILITPPSPGGISPIPLCIQAEVDSLCSGMILSEANPGTKVLSYS